MADLTKTIEVIFAGVDNISGVISGVGRGVSGFSSSVGSVTGPISSFTGSLLKVEAGIIAVGAAALGYAVNESVKFESAMLDFKKVASGLSDEDLPALITKIEGVGIEFGTSSTDVLEAATNFVQAGFSVEEAFDLVKVAATAAVVSELSAAQASDVLVRSLKGFEVGASEAGRLLDIFNKVSDSTAASFPELANGFADLAPIAKTMGLSFEETAAFLTPIIERFGSGSEAANALKTAFSKLVDPTKETREALDAVGIAQRNASGEFLTGRPLLESVQKSFKDLTDENKLFVAAQLVGINQAARFVPILGDTVGFQKALAAATNSSGSALAEFNVRIQSTEFQIQRMGVSFDNAARQIGDEFRPLVGQGADALRTLFDAVGKLVADGKLDTFFNALKPIFETFNATIKDIAKNLGGAFDTLDFTPIARALKDLGGSFSALFDNVDLSTPEGLASALQKIVNLGAGLINFTSGVIQGFQPLLDLLTSSADKANEFGAEFFSALGQIAGLATSINAVLPVIGLLGAAITIVGSAFGTLSILKGAGVVLELSTITGAVTTLGAALGKAGLAGLVGTAAYSLTSLAVNSKVGQGAMTSLLDVIGDMTGQTEKSSAALGAMTFKLDESGKSATSAAEKIDKYQKSQKTTEQSTEEWANSIAEVTKSFLDAGYVYDSTTGYITKQGDALDEIAQSAEFAKDSQAGYTKSVEDGTTSFEQFGTSAHKSLSTVAEEAKKAKIQTEKIQETMLKLASDERIKTMEFAVKLNVAQIEADTARIKSAFDSIGKGLDSTASVINNAISALGNVKGFYGLEQLRLIETQLEKENEYRAKEIELQEKLTEATIREANARADAIAKGGGLINIDAKGLEPEIEAFMFKILKKIQVRANAEAASFLLGV